jgi:hypothetical protein
MDPSLGAPGESPDEGPAQTASLGESRQGTSGASAHIRWQARHPVPAAGVVSLRVGQGPAVMEVSKAEAVCPEVAARGLEVTPWPEMERLGASSPMAP